MQTTQNTNPPVMDLFTAIALALLSLVILYVIYNSIAAVWRLREGVQGDDRTWLLVAAALLVLGPGIGATMQAIARVGSIF